MTFISEARNRNLWRMFAPLALVLALFLAGCAGSVALAPPEEDKKAKTMQVPPDKALIYIFRSGRFGGAVHVEATVDEIVLGRLNYDTYYLVETAPRKLTVHARAENTRTLDLDAQAGHAYYVRAFITPGFLTGRIGLDAESKERGTELIEKCRLVRMEQMK